MRLFRLASLTRVRTLVIVLGVNVLVTYCIFRSLLPPVLERMNSGRRPAGFQSKQLKQYVLRDAEEPHARAQDGRRTRGKELPGGDAAWQLQGFRPRRPSVMEQAPVRRAPLDGRPKSLAARRRMRVPLLQFADIEIPTELQSQNALEARRGKQADIVPPTVSQAHNRPKAGAVALPVAGGGGAVAGAGGGGAPAAAAAAATTYGGLFDYKGAVNVMWGRAFYFDEHTIGIVLLRPPRAQRRQVCTYRGVNAKAMEFKGSMGESHGAPVDKLTVICRYESAISPPSEGETVEIWDAPKIPIFAYDIAKPFTWSVCTPPLHVNARYEWVSQLLRFYTSKLSADYLFFYSAIRDLTAARLTELGVESAGQYSSVIDMSSQLEFKPYFFAQTTAIHDCLYLNRHLKTEWTLFQDLDELIVLPSKWPDPMSFFEAHKEKSAITFGMWSVDSRVCRPESEVEPQDEEWPLIARMKKATRGPYCGNMCIDWRGRRKYALQPSRVDALFIHKPIARPILNLPVSDGFLRNYWRAQNKDVQYCAQIDASKL